MEDLETKGLSMPSAGRRSGAGRPEVTSHAEIEQAAFRLFAEQGFEATTVEAIADEVGVSRRTLFRYYSSKNDIPWGQFDRTLEGFRELLGSMPAELPLLDAVGRGVVEFNRFPADASPSHAERMRLILETPALRAHSAIRYAEWRGVISDYVGRRLGMEAHSLQPQLVGHVSLALALTAYDLWLREPESTLTSLLEQGLSSLMELALEAHTSR
jgi:mycofactocin system transcriptional regulator